MMNEKISILYHSGAGSTKFTSEIIASQLKGMFDVDIRHIDFHCNYRKLYDYDLLIYGFPTYHCEPSTSMMDFIKQIPKLEKPIKTLFFTSYGLYTGNCLRIFHQELNKRNFEVLGYFQFRSPGSDGVLMFSPRLKFMFRFEKNYNGHIKKVVSEIKNFKNLNKKIPPTYKWYVPLNEIAKYFGKREYDKMRNKMQIVTDLCTNCNLCVVNCERMCWTSNDLTPTFEPDNCEFCLECIHKCPQNAIVYSEKMKDKPRLNKTFFNKHKKSVLNEFL